ncbi:beta-lactamase-like protein [Paraphysoderma sedebokerense]|nr:beta-lactamase-like protein [Paraphysoderma sedebokerense]
MTLGNALFSVAYINRWTNKKETAHSIITDDNISSAKAYLIIDESEPIPVLEYLSTLTPKPTLSAILTTHRHHDHSGGNHYLKQNIENLDIYGGVGENVPYANKTVNNGDTIGIGKLVFTVLQTPCHTRGHVMYYLDMTQSGASGGGEAMSSLFTGDTIFKAGVGKFFEGSAAQMLENIQNVVTRFNTHVEKQNEEIQSQLQIVQTRRANKQSTVPSSISWEQKCNPYFRVDKPTVVEFVKENYLMIKGNEATDVNVMEGLRKLKDAFKG